MNEQDFRVELFSSTLSLQIITLDIMPYFPIRKLMQCVHFDTKRTRVS